MATYSTADGEQTIIAERIITTTGAYTLPALLPFVPKEKMERISNLHYAPVVQASVGFRDTGALRFDAFGGLVPSCEKKDVLGILFPSACFTGRAPEEGALFSFFIGGVKHADLTTWPEEELKALIRRELHTMLKFPEETEPDMIRIFRHEHAIPQYEQSSGSPFETIEELHILQPGSAIHISARTPERFLRAGCKVIRQGHGYPSVFNPDVYIQELMRQGKSLQDAREGGCSGCIEVGAFGKEAYVLTGYLNVPKILEVTLHNGVDPVSGRKVGLETGDPRSFGSYDELYAAFMKQVRYFVDMKVRVSNYIDRMFAKYAPATFLSLFIDDCIAKGRDYYNCGPRYNTTYIQCTGLGTITDSLVTLKKHIFEDKRWSMDELLKAMADNFEGAEAMRQTILNRTPFFGNDDEYADSIAVKVFDDLYDTIEGKPNTKGECFHLNMLSTTCHVYFGKVMGATPNGRLAGRAISDGTSPSHGADTHGPSAVIKSLGKLDQVKSGGTLLNQRFLPSLLKREEDISKLSSLIRSYFALGGHHIQFNIVDTETLYAAQKCPEDYRDLLVRVAGYSDYFNDMNADLQADVIMRTEQETF